MSEYWEPNWEIKRSALHGVGVFATRTFYPGALIGAIHARFVGMVGDFASQANLPTTGIVTRDGEIYIPVAGFPLWVTNYSNTPNLLARRSGVIAIAPIKPGDELTVKQAYAQPPLDVPPLSA